MMFTSILALGYAAVDSVDVDQEIALEASAICR
jgi:hypothetical protein